MSTSDFLFSGSGPASFTNSTSTNPNIPSWFESAIQGLLTQGAAITSAPYQTSPIPAVAPLTQLQQQETPAVQALQDQYSPYIAQAEGTAGQVGQGFNNEQFQKYLTPELSGANSEISQLQALANQNLTQPGGILQTINNGEIANGMFGNAAAPGSGTLSPNDQFDQLAIQNANTSLLQSEGNVLNNAYNSALGAYGTGQQQALGAASLQGNLAGAGENIGLENLGALQNVGGQMQQQGQNNLNVENQQFYNQEQYPLQMLNEMASLVSGFQPQVGNTSYGIGPANFNTPSIGATTGATAALGGLGNLYNGINQIV